MVALGHERLPLGHAGFGLRRVASPGWVGNIALPAACAALGACAPAGSVTPPEVTFDSAVVWVRQDTDSTRALVEVATTRAQHEIGLAGRATLGREAGMLFLFDQTRSPDEGFWMWQTRVPLDIAFIGADDVIHAIHEMDPCTAPTQEECPGYFPDAPYRAALEMSGGCFARQGIAVGASVRVER